MYYALIKKIRIHLNIFHIGLDQRTWHEAAVLLPQVQLGLRLQNGPECPFIRLHQEHQQPDNLLQLERVRGFPIRCNDAGFESC